jgi:F0F1-type ATP synthase assembly protein I
MKKNEESFWVPLWREAFVALSLGWDMAIPIFGGVLLGYALDRWLATGHIFTLGLLVLGIGLSYYNLARFIRRVDKQAQQLKEDEKKEASR